MNHTNAVIAALAIIIFPSLAYAQQARPSATKLAAAPSTSSARPTFRVKSFKFSGNTVFSAAELGALVQSYVDKDYDLRDLQRIADLVTEKYRKAGYIVAVVIPEQEVKDDTVLFNVIEGKLGKVEVSSQTKLYKNDHLRSNFEKNLRGDDPKAAPLLRQKSLERAILLLQDQPGLNSVSANLRRGDDPGTVNVDLSVREKPGASDGVRGSIEFNTFGSRFASRERISPQVDLANLSGNGDDLKLRVVTGTEPQDLLFGTAVYSMPIDTNGTSLSAYFLGGRFEVGQEFAILNIEGRGLSYGISAKHPFVRSNRKTITGEVALDLKDSRQDLLGALSSQDKIRSIRVGASLESNDQQGKNLAGLFVHQGLGKILGAMADGDPFASRFGADNRFTKVTLDAARIHRFNNRVFLLGRGSGQVSTRSLVVGEQFSVGGADTVRGYPQSEFLGDNGYQLSLEARFSPFVRKLHGLQLTTFVDHGFISVKNPVAGQRRSQRLSGMGIGARANLNRNTLFLRADLGFAIGQKASSGGRAIPYFQVIQEF